MTGAPPRSLGAALWGRPAGRAGVILLGALVLTAVVAPWWLPDPAAQPDLAGGALLPPGPGHLLGTDQLSRDLLARVVSGGRISLSTAAVAVAVSATIGVLVGVTAGYRGGWLDALLMRLVDAALAVPRIFILLLLLTAWERVPLPALVLVLGATGWFGTSRLVRAEVLRLRSADFIRAAQALGADAGRVVRRHLIPNILGPVLVSAALGAGDVILVEAGLSFLGLGLRPPTPSWGAMILEATPTAPWTLLFPGLAILVTVLAVTLVADALRDVLDPHHR